MQTQASERRVSESAMEITRANADGVVTRRLAITPLQWQEFTSGKHIDAAISSLTQEERDFIINREGQ